MSVLALDTHALILATLGLSVATNLSLGALWYLQRNRGAAMAGRGAPQAKRRISELKMCRILNHMPIGISASGLDLDSRISFLNEEFVRGFGYELDQVPTVADWFRLAYPDPKQHARVTETWAATVAEACRTNGRVRPQEYRVTCRDGSTRDVLISASVIDDMLLVAFLDISERKAMQMRLKASEERFRLLADHIPDNIWTMDRRYRMTFISPSIENLTGYSQEEFLSLTLDGQVAPGSLKTAYEYLQGVNEHHPVPGQTPHFRGEIELRCKDGSTIWTEIVATPLFDDEGKLIEVAGVTRDIRARRDYEVVLHKAREAAEAANTAKSRFLAHMSHEIRTPMAGIVGLAQLALRQDPDDRQREYLLKIENSATSLLRVLNDILDFSKIEAGKLQLETTTFDLRQLVDRLFHLLTVTLGDRPLTLRLDYPPAAGRYFEGDPLRLSQVLTNLLSNALKFTRVGEVSLAIAKTDEGRIRFTVTDTGIGVTPEQQQRLFHAFNQAETSTTRHFGGTGLGLSISKQLVELMGGRIHLTSVPGQGSRVSFALPLSAGSPPNQTFAPGEGGPDFSGQRVLLVEDDPVNREIVVGSLEGTGLEILIAHDGRQALDLFQREPCDLILMDVQMGVMDGYEATRRIRALPPPLNAQVPIIALSASVLEEEVKKALEVGMNAHISKPIEWGRLYAVLRAYLKDQSPAMSWGAPSAGTEHPTTRSPAKDASAEELAAVNTPAGKPESMNLPGAEEAGTGVHIDAGKALALMGGNEQLLRQILEGFVIEVGGLDLDLKDQDTARRLHTIKGLSGNVGAVRLQALAAAIEGSMKAGRTPDDKLLVEFRQELAEVRETIRQFLE